MNTFVSIVVRTWNRAPLLRGALASLISQNYPHDCYEIVVSDDGSTDDTPTVVREFASSAPPRVEYMRQAHTGANAARNAGIAVAGGDLICVVDDDIEAPPGWLRAMTEGAARHPAAECLGGPIRTRIVGRQPRFCGRETIEETELDLGPHDTIGPLLWSPNMAVRRSALETVGHFRDDHPVYGDEVEWEQRLIGAGGITAYIADAWLWHRVGNLVRTSFRRGRRRVVYSEFYGEPVSIGRELAGIPRVLGHAVFRRCEWGILATSGRLGAAWERIRRMMRSCSFSSRSGTTAADPGKGFAKLPARDA
jgi:glycosyltransferase involved in cell wall biosynthesis